MGRLNAFDVNFDLTDNKRRSTLIHWGAFAFWCRIMFAKSRGSSTAPCDLLPDPIRSTYEIGKQSATAGPENVWRIYDGYRKKDRMVSSAAKEMTIISCSSKFISSRKKSILEWNGMLLQLYRKSKSERFVENKM